MAKYVYSFGPQGTDGDATQKNLLGGKGANLAEMSRIGLPVPPGFTISTEECTYYYENGETYAPETEGQVNAALAKMEEEMGKKFGDTTDPLLVSCRSGARESMPGMMDTVLNIGLNDTTVAALAKKAGDERFAWDCYRRFVQMYGDVVLEMKPESKQDIDPFEEILEKKKEAAGVKLDSDLTAAQLKELVTEFKAAVKKQTGHDFPESPMDQLWGAIGAVFGSWMNDRAIVYRRTYGIPHEWGTAVNVQAMAFGNLGDDCATGVALTRDGALGTPGVNGDYLINAQGEDVVAGIRVTKKIETEMEGDMPEIYKQLLKVANTLENHYRDIQDIEFTIEKGQLWLLQTRNAKRTGFAAVRAAVDMVNEGLITPEEALNPRRVPADSITQLLQPVFAGEKGDVKPLTSGINAGPGAATGQIVFQPDDAEAKYQADPSAEIILVRRETTPEDLRGMKVAKGILTAFGGAASHAALVSRQMGKACVCGCSDLEIDYKAGTMTVGKKVLKEGDYISIDGFSGEVFDAKMPTSASEVLQVLCDGADPKQAPVYQRFQQLMSWADRYRKLLVRTNADQPREAKQAVQLGAQGIGLCRTEHMFFDHIDDFRAMILADNTADREKALEKLLPYQRDDFAGLFREMDGRPVTVRLLDPPLHEFLPHEAEEQAELAKKLGIKTKEVTDRVEELAESNPMLGHRGCRLGIVYPEITRMQARAICEAACLVMQEGIDVHPEIMVPLIGSIKEFKDQEKVIRETASTVFKEQATTVDYMVGTMIEIPRAALTADEVATGAEFFSFGTNDLTQTGMGISRDDYGGFVNDYQEKDIFPADPFQTLDTVGIGKLMKIAVEGGKSTRPDIKLGICGEHGGDPASVAFCHEIGLQYVSCSPLRVPVARLAAAQVAIAEKQAKCCGKEGCCCK
ncbi:MAG: pyruvate, phosphate dikinase [Planctomycetia bacterium]|jgi:pyruvate,orthophosphate dikinase